MPRVKRGVTARARHKKVLSQAKGFRGRVRIERALSQRRQTTVAQHISAENKTLGLQIIQPLAGFVDIAQCQLMPQFVVGQR